MAPFCIFMKKELCFLPDPQKKMTFISLCLPRLLLLLLLFQVSINIPPSFSLSSVILSPLALPLRLPSILVPLLCEWRDSGEKLPCWLAGATLTRSDALTGSGMTYYGGRPNAGRAVTDTLTSICCGSKVTERPPSNRLIFTTAEPTWRSVHTPLSSDPSRTRCDSQRTAPSCVDFFPPSRNKQINPQLENRTLQDVINRSDEVCLFSRFLWSPKTELNQLDVFSSSASDIVYSSAPGGPLP